MKKLLALVLTLVMIFALAAPTAFAEEKTVLNIWSFTDEVPGMIEKYLERNPEFADKYEIKADEGNFGLSNVAATVVNLLGYDAPCMWDESIIEIK